MIDVIGEATREELLCALARRALKGDVGAARLLLERTDAVPRTHVLQLEQGRELVLRMFEHALGLLIELIPLEKREEAFEILTASPYGDPELEIRSGSEVHPQLRPKSVKSS